LLEAGELEQAGTRDSDHPAGGQPPSIALESYAASPVSREVQQQLSCLLDHQEREHKNCCIGLWDTTVLKSADGALVRLETARACWSELVHQIGRITMSKTTDRTTGAWVIAHSLKLAQVNTQGQFLNIETAGKFGRVLSLLSASEQQVIKQATLKTLAKANNINPNLELETLLKQMEDRHLIDRSASGDVAVLGITHSSVLERAAEHFNSLSPDAEEKAVIDIAEKASQSPLPSSELAAYISDAFKMKKAQTKEFLEQAEEIGFVDAQELDAATKEKLYFNGNIFRTKNTEKLFKVLRSLKPDEQRLVQEFEQKLAQRGYSTVEEARNVLGDGLFAKLQTIALFDVNKVANDREEMLYITRPASFAKYGNPWEEDTLDYAKALVSSLAYGMTRSSAGRGQITWVRRLVEKLIRGEWLNDNTAAGEDYKYLEFKRVVETKPGERWGYNLRLLKREVGVVALEVLTQGAASSESLIERLPGAPVSSYSGPEANRVQLRRKKVVAQSDRKVREMLESLRTGRIE
jgi:hypothetical protein